LRIVILGLGYVGCTAAGCIASQGHHVTGVDVSQSKVETLNAGRSPITEPGLEALIAEARGKGLLEASTTIGGSLDEADIAIVCVGTPSGITGAHDMSYVAQVTTQIAAAVSVDRATPLTVAYRSTMRPGTIESLIAPIFAAALGDDWGKAVSLVYNPEFLRESSAIKDYFEPPKIVIGTADGEPNAAMEGLHAGIEATVFHTRYREAEITKFVDNTWHAVKVAFANEVGRVCALQDISAATVHAIFKSDTKLNLSAYYTRPGGAFGGSCLPKDVRALQYISGELGANTPLIDMLMRSNDAHKHFHADRVMKLAPPGSTVLLVGLAFKAETDDLRESPNVDLARKLLEGGYQLSIFDPAIEAERLIGQNLGYAHSNLPSLRKLLVDKATAEATRWDVAIAANRTIKELTVNAGILVDIDAIG